MVNTVTQHLVLGMLRIWQETQFYKKKKARMELYHAIDLKKLCKSELNV